MQLYLDILPPLNWLDFLSKTLLSSYSVMCSLWQPLSAIESPAKSKLTTTSYLLLWKLHLYYKIDGDPSEISRTSVSMFCHLGLAGRTAASLMMTCNTCPNCAHAHCITKSSVSTPTVLLEYTSCIDLQLLLACMYICSQVVSSYIQCARCMGRAAITTEASGH